MRVICLCCRHSSQHYREGSEPLDFCQRSTRFTPVPIWISSRMSGRTRHIWPQKSTRWSWPQLGRYKVISSRWRMRNWEIQQDKEYSFQSHHYYQNQQVIRQTTCHSVANQLAKSLVAKDAAWAERDVDGFRVAFVTFTIVLNIAELIKYRGQCTARPRM